MKQKILQIEVDRLIKPFKKKQTLWPLFMDGVQLPQGYSHLQKADA